MAHDHALTPARIDALNAVDLRLVGVTHGITRYEGNVPHVERGSSDDFDRLLAATNELSAERGDALATEPTGFQSAWAEDMTLANILPIVIPDIPVADMPQEQREDIAAFLEQGRHELYLNNLAYAAAHTLLRGVPVHRAEVSKGDWEALGSLLPELGPSDAQEEIGLFYRNSKMLARLGDRAIDISTSRSNQANIPADNTKPILLFASGRTHTSRLGDRLDASGISFTSNL